MFHRLLQKLGRQRLSVSLNTWFKAVLLPVVARRSRTRKASLSVFEKQILQAIANLTVVMPGEISGIPLHRHLETTLGRDVLVSALYKAFLKLEAQGLITSEHKPYGASGDLMRYVTITKSGRVVLNQPKEEPNRVTFSKKWSLFKMS